MQTNQQEVRTLAEEIKKLFDDCYDTTVPGKTFKAELEKLLASHLHPEAPAADNVDADYLARLADEIDSTMFFREIDYVEADPQKLRHQIANLIRMKALRMESNPTSGDRG